jgi:transcription antitermination factor NusG
VTVDAISRWYVVHTRPCSEAKAALNLDRQGWWSIRSTFGVSDLVCNGEQPAFVPSAIIEDIKGREDQHGFVTLPRQRPGDRFRIVDGVFSACFGTKSVRFSGSILRRSFCARSEIRSSSCLGRGRCGIKCCGGQDSWG